MIFVTTVNWFDNELAADVFLFVSVMVDSIE